MKAALLLVALLLGACTTVTQVVEIDCQTIEFYPPWPAQPDSAIYRNCQPPEWEGMIVRFNRR